MTPAEIAAARALCDAALPGPWTVDRQPSSDGSTDYYPEPVFEPAIDRGILAPSDHVVVPTNLAEADAAFIAAARTGWPAALDEIERLRAGATLTLGCSWCDTWGIADKEALREHASSCAAHPGNQRAEAAESQNATLAAERDLARAEVERLRVALQRVRTPLDDLDGLGRDVLNEHDVDIGNEIRETASRALATIGTALAESEPQGKPEGAT